MTTPQPTPADDAATAERLIASWFAECASRGPLQALDVADRRDRWQRLHTFNPAEVDDLEAWMQARLNSAITEATLDPQLGSVFYATRDDNDALTRWLKAQGYR